MARLRRRAIDRPRLADIDAELVLAQSGRDVGMSLSKDIRVHPQGNPCADPLLRRPLSEQLDLRLTLYVKNEDAGTQRKVHLGRRLPYSRENNPLGGLLAERQHPFQFATRNDVETAAL